MSPDTIRLTKCSTDITKSGSSVCEAQAAFTSSLLNSGSKQKRRGTPDSKVHGAYMGPTWGRQDPGGPHVGPWSLLSTTRHPPSSLPSLLPRLTNWPFKYRILICWRTFPFVGVNAPSEVNFIHVISIVVTFELASYIPESGHRLLLFNLVKWGKWDLKVRLYLWNMLIVFPAQIFSRLIGKMIIPFPGLTFSW